MKCPKKDKNCKNLFCAKSKSHYICSGINKKPTKYKKDIVKLCLKGKFVENFNIEMTLGEAALMSAALNVAMSERLE